MQIEETTPPAVCITATHIEVRRCSVTCIPEMPLQQAAGSLNQPRLKMLDFVDRAMYFENS